MILKTILVVILLASIAGLFYFRVATVPAKHFDQRNGPMEIGAYPATGGHRVVIAKPSDIDIANLTAAILATPRTIEIPTDLPDTRIFQTRSLLWGFPDITHMTTTQDTLILDSHLVFGQSDLGVNKARIERWLADIER